MRTVDCPFTVTFYGALFREVGGSTFEAAAVTEKDVFPITQTPAQSRGASLSDLSSVESFMLVKCWCKVSLKP